MSKVLTNIFGFILSGCVGGFFIATLFLVAEFIDAYRSGAEIDAPDGFGLMGIAGITIASLFIGIVSFTTIGGIYSILIKRFDLAFGSDIIVCLLATIVFVAIFINTNSPIGVLASLQPSGGLSLFVGSLTAAAICRRWVKLPLHMALRDAAILKD